MAQTDNKQLREGRLIFYQDLVRDANRLLREFLKLSNAKCAMLVDKEGHMVTRQGVTRDLDMDTISALVAGSFAATKQMAKLLGEEEFSIMFHQGKKDNIQLSLVGERTILAVIFDDKTTLGMVRLYASQVSSKLGELFSEIADRKSEGEKISQEFGQAAKGKLDDIFGT